MGDAIFQQRSGYLGVGIVGRCGLLTPNQLAGLGDLARSLECRYCKMTTRQTLIFIIPENRLEELKAGVAALGLKVGVFGEIVRNVKACAGNQDLCQRALSDVFELGGKLQDHFMNRPTPCDFKIALAGCHRGCTDPLCADYGIIATSNDNYDVYIGGRGGSRKPVHATRIATSITGAGVSALLEHILKRYGVLGEPRERLCNTIKRVSLEAFLPPEGFLDPYRPSEENDFLNFAKW
ncbi:nitrite reductase [Moorella naiadis]|uniref:nitrite reductase n=1 Tax=Moorella naiadis (nom. illeg.) TaxID=3093670 RepID=UPI003D9CAB35